jgi:hypothetical protein
MTTQEIYDIVKKHLLVQNAASMFEEGICAYRDATGRKCAVGCLIPDEKYSSDIEGHNIFDDDVQQACGVTDPKQVKLLYDLQCIHDTVDPGDWSYRLALVADEHNLTP